MLSRRHDSHRQDHYETRTARMVIVVSLITKTVSTQSRFQTGSQSVCPHTANTRPQGPKQSLKLARSPPKRTGISLDPSAPSLSSPRSGVSHRQHPPNAISNSHRTNGSVSTMTCSRTYGPLRCLTRCSSLTDLSHSISLANLSRLAYEYYTNES
jgi:hypothetical protein